MTEDEVASKLLGSLDFSCEARTNDQRCSKPASWYLRSRCCGVDEVICEQHFLYAVKNLCDPTKEARCRACGTTARCGNPDEVATHKYIGP